MDDFARLLLHSVPQAILGQLRTVFGKIVDGSENASIPKATQALACRPFSLALVLYREENGTNNGEADHPDEG